MATVSINSEQITSIANSLKGKGEQILTQYKDTCASALQMSTQCLQMSGLDTEQFFKGLESVYIKLSERVGALSDFLINNVASDYDALSQAITNSFNNDFANEFSSLIGLGGNSGGSVYTIQPINENSKIPSLGKKTLVEGVINNKYIVKGDAKLLEPAKIDNSYRLAVEPTRRVYSSDVTSATLGEKKYKLFSK